MRKVSAHLLTPFYTAPVVYIGITKGTLATARAYLVECITALSATLQTVALKSCSFPSDLIHEILLAHSDLKRLYLDRRDIKPTNSGYPATTHLGPHSTDVELGVFSAANLQGRSPAMDSILQLQVQFRRINLDYIRGQGATHPLNTLIKIKRHRR